MFRSFLEVLLLPIKAVSRSWHSYNGIIYLNKLMEGQNDRIEYLEKQVEYERSEKKEFQRKLDRALKIEPESNEPYRSGIKVRKRAATEREDEVPEDNLSDAFEP